MTRGGDLFLVVPKSRIACTVGYTSAHCTAKLTETQQSSSNGGRTGGLTRSAMARSGNHSAPRPPDQSSAASTPEPHLRLACVQSTPSIACRQMGFTAGSFRAVTSTDSTAEVPPPWLSSVQCVGFEPRLSQCERSVFGDTSTCGASLRLFCSSGGAHLHSKLPPPPFIYACASWRVCGIVAALSAVMVTHPSWLMPL